jgi:hypothetical protein
MLFQRIHFTKADPDDNGLIEEIAQEQLEPEAISPEEGIDARELDARWQEIVSDLEKDPTWFRSIEE